MGILRHRVLSASRRPALRRFPTLFGFFESIFVSPKDHSEPTDNFNDHFDIIAAMGGGCSSSPSAPFAPSASSKKEPMVSHFSRSRRMALCFKAHIERMRYTSIRIHYSVSRSMHLQFYTFIPMNCLERQSYSY